MCTKNYDDPTLFSETKMTLPSEGDRLHKTNLVHEGLRGTGQRLLANV